MKTNHQTTKARRRRSALTLVPLWASAFVLAGMLLVQLGRLGPGNTALGEMVATGVDYTLLTTDSGNGEYLSVLNNRNGEIYVYEVTSGSGMVLADVVRMADFVKRQQVPGDGN